MLYLVIVLVFFMAYFHILLNLIFIVKKYARIENLLLFLNLLEKVMHVLWWWGYAGDNVVFKKASLNFKVICTYCMHNT